MRSAIPTPARPSGSAHQLAAYGQIKNKARRRQCVGASEIVRSRRQASAFTSSALRRIAFNRSIACHPVAVSELAKGARVAWSSAPCAGFYDVEVITRAPFTPPPSPWQRLWRLSRPLRLPRPPQSIQPFRCSKRIGFVIEDAFWLRGTRAPNTKLSLVGVPLENNRWTPIEA